MPTDSVDSSRTTICINCRLESTWVETWVESTHRIWVDWLIIANLRMRRTDNSKLLLQLCQFLFRKNCDSDSSAVFIHLSGIGYGTGIKKESEKELFSNSQFLISQTAIKNHNSQFLIFGNRNSSSWFLHLQSNYEWTLPEIAPTPTERLHRM